MKYIYTHIYFKVGEDFKYELSNSLCTFSSFIFTKVDDVNFIPH